MKIEWTLKRRIKAKKQAKMKTTYFGAKQIGYSAANLSEIEEKQLRDKLFKANEDYLDIYIKKIRGLYIHQEAVKFLRNR